MKLILLNVVSIGFDCQMRRSEIIFHTPTDTRSICIGSSDRQDRAEHQADPEGEG